MADTARMTQATDMLAAYIAAEQAILLGKEVRFMDRWVKMEDLAEVRKGRIEWESKVRNEAGQIAGVSGIRVAVANFNGVE